MARFPDARWRHVPSTTDPQIEPIGVILHVDAGNARSLFDWWMSDASKGIESHFHVAKDGYTEQYRDTNQEADANYKGNSFIRDGIRVGFISVETQGFFDGEWTPQQLARIKEILEWAEAEHPLVQLREAPSPYDPGVGYHVMWGAPGDWTPVAGKTCPGPRRIDQFYDDIVPWMKGTSMADHRHAPMPDDLPRSWANDTWRDYAAHSGTKDDTREHTMYREDISWVWERLIKPLEESVARLEGEVERLQGGSSPSVYGTVVKLTKP